MPGAAEEREGGAQREARREGHEEREGGAVEGQEELQAPGAREAEEQLLAVPGRLLRGCYNMIYYTIICYTIITYTIIQYTLLEVDIL